MFKIKKHVLIIEIIALLQFNSDLLKVYKTFKTQRHFRAQ